MLHGMWDFRSQPGIEAVHFAVEMQSLNHWTTKEVLSPKKKKKFCLCISQCILMCFPLVHVHLYQHSIHLFLFPSPPNYPGLFINVLLYHQGIHFQRGKCRVKGYIFKEVKFSSLSLQQVPRQMPSILCVSGKDGLDTAPIIHMCE